MFGDERIISGTGNVFADLGLPNADERLLKARLATVIGETIGQLRLTQNAAATRLGIAQSDVSNLLRGRLRGFSIERLFGFVRILGNDVEIRIRPPARELDHRRHGHLRMMVG